MVIRNPDIHFTISLYGEDYEVHTYYGEYRNLMALLYDKLYTEGFGECRGMGRCGTCLVEISGVAGDLTGMNRNEQATLSKTVAHGSAHRLSCQLQVDAKLHNARIRIVE